MSIGYFYWEDAFPNSPLIGEFGKYSVKRFRGFARIGYANITRNLPAYSLIHSQFAGS